MADSEITFTADFEEARQEVDSFYESLANGLGNARIEVEPLNDVADAADNVTRANQGLLESLDWTDAAFVAGAVSVAALAAGLGALYAAYRLVSAGVNVFMDSLQIAMKAEDEAYEKAVALAKANGDVAPANHTLSNSFKEIGETITAAKGALGEAFLPLVKELVPICKVLADVVLEIATAWAEWLASISDTSGLSNLEDVMLRIAAHALAVSENIKGLMLNMETAAYMAANMFTWEDDIEGKLDEFNESQRKRHGYTGEDAFIPEWARGNKEAEQQFKDAKGKADYANALNNPTGDPKRVEEIYQDLQERLKEKKATPAEEDAIVSWKNQMQDFWDLGVKKLGEGILDGSDKGAKMYLKYLDEGAEALGDALGILDPSALSDAADEIRKSQKDSEKKGFQATLETDAKSIAQSFQQGINSREDIPMRQLTALEQQILRMDEQKIREEEGNRTLGSLLDEYRNAPKNQPARAG
jgi:hypothetical protein